MIFESLTVFQNIIFIVAILSAIILIVYLILPALDFYKQREVVSSDDIDSQTEPYENINGFILSAFKIKGSLFFLVFASWFCLLFSFFLADWISVLIGIFIGICATIVAGFLGRRPVGENGDLAIVSIKIPGKSMGTGKVILLENDSEVDAETEGHSIKKGKKVVVVQNLITKVIVKKLKRKSEKQKKGETKRKIKKKSKIIKNNQK